MGNKQLKSGNGTLQPVPEQRTFVVFAVAGYHLALPIEIIVQVIRCPARLDSDLGKAGLMQIGQHLIQVINIEQKSDESCDRQPGGNQDFLIVIADPERKLYGIVVDEPPNLMKQPSNKIQALPSANYQSPVLNRVSHMIAREHTDNPNAIFLLNLDKLYKQNDCLELL